MNVRCRWTVIIAEDDASIRLLPLVVSEARYFIRDLAELNLPRDLRAKAAFRIRLRKTVPTPFTEIRADPLIVHLRGAGELPGQIYEQIFAHKLRLVIQSGGGRQWSDSGAERYGEPDAQRGGLRRPIARQQVRRRPALVQYSGLRHSGCRFLR